MTLIEVMVATVVIAIGLLGVAALQVSALQGASNADYRSKAIDFGSALADRMHANLMAFDVDDNFDNAYTPAVAINCETPPAAVCAMTPTMTSTAGISECNPTQMAAYDLQEISCGEGLASLPDGWINISCLDNDTADADDCTILSPMLITVSWDLQSDDNATEQVVLTVVPGAP
ncbi:MAG: type IV pilus modification protein PilV [Candidatus Thiodiazotropha sp. (ex Ctena orbiculata)]|uniref:Type IV pilus modification protein PilV n=1 Tax=Candidatus Thiodiazotropha taylori TaxID=2792791 RepID=A0A944QRZ6_9GAMM|nr:type IV pilus modification protein PilV [Candidatus Thiodiazotropha taylori]MBV2136453.1 type IV pilus modification protein PilV [Candidatus Thiodiazotropha taylori]